VLINTEALRVLNYVIFQKYSKKDNLIL